MDLIFAHLSHKLNAGVIFILNQSKNNISLIMHGEEKYLQKGIAYAKWVKKKCCKHNMVVRLEPTYMYLTYPAFSYIHT